MQLWRYSGIVLIITAVFHNLVGLYLGWDILREIVHDGVWDTIAVTFAASTEQNRAELVWFLTLGFSWITLGASFHSHIKRQQQALSRSWGWALFSQGAMVVIVLPQSGAWLIIAQSFIIIFAAKNSSHA